MKGRRLFVQDTIYEANDGIDWSEFSADEFALHVDTTRVIMINGVLMMFDITQDDMGDIYLSNSDIDGGYYEIGGESEVI